MNKLFALIFKTCLFFLLLIPRQDILAQKASGSKPAPAPAPAPAAAAEPGAAAGSILQSDRYQFFVDLTQVKDDKLAVSLIAPKIAKKDDADEILYRLPKIVPGTYSIYDFGRFVSELRAFDITGKELNVARIDDNSFRISQASRLYKITYQVDDTFDAKQSNFVFEPAGTNIEASKNFVINTHGFFGYFEDLKRLSYEINITRPGDFYGSTSMVASSTGKTLQTPAADTSTDLFTMPNYMDLVDAPVMYCRPDTTLLNVGGAEILVSVYSPNKRLDSKYVAAQIKDVLSAQKEYLGGKLPISKYAFIIYLYKEFISGSGAYGALEHSYSSMYFLPESFTQARLVQTIKDVAAHEFFHIITPLNIHSQEIHDFDYINPRMSKHLWLYEGVTEYFAGHVQVKYGLISMDEYLDMLRKKMIYAEEYNQQLAFTELSKKCLDEHKDEYGNVYEKGALIGLCLDIRLRQLSGGKYSLQQLMADLSRIYGKNRPFNDEELFDQITKLTYPEIRSFFKNYVEDAQPLPLKEMLGLAGIYYSPEETSKLASMGGIQVVETDEGLLQIVDNSQMDAFGDALGFQTDDILLQINKIKLTEKNAVTAVNNFRTTAKAGQKVTIVVQRMEKGKPVNKKLKAKIVMVEETTKHLLRPDPAANAGQLQLRAQWLK